MANIKIVLLLFFALLQGCLSFTVPRYIYSLGYRNACGFSVEATLSSKSQTGILNPGEEFALVVIMTNEATMINDKYWQNILPNDETLTVKTNNNSISLSKEQIMELLRNKNAHKIIDNVYWLINDPSLCP
jgi:hypothetical protein